ncbi:MAG: rhamnan synthesis F family protein [Desulfobacterales bacterium]
MGVEAEMVAELKMTGERFLPEMQGDIALEHIHRYLMARELARGKDVLDIASGEGYGANLLAEVAKTVIGVDISENAVRHAKKKYNKANLDFKTGSCAEIPLPDKSIDVCVSFETIEHHDQHDVMMIEIKRVLRENGVLILSTPDKYHYSTERDFKNPFHVRELYRQDFENLMTSYFKNVIFYGQRILYGSGIFCQGHATKHWCSSIQEPTSLVNGILRPLYLIAVASDQELPKIASSFLEQTVREVEIPKSSPLNEVESTKSTPHPDAPVRNDFHRGEEIDAFAEVERVISSAREAAERNDFEKAIELLEELLRRNPQELEAHHLLGLVMSLSQEKKAAEEHLRKAWEGDPTHPTFLLDYADYILVEFGRAEEAMDLYHRLLVGQPYNIDVLLRLGNQYAVRKSYEEARFLYSKVLSLHPGHAQAMENLKFLSAMAEENEDANDVQIGSRPQKGCLTPEGSGTGCTPPAVSLRCFLNDGREALIEHPLAAPDLNRPERFCFWFELSGIRGLNALKLDLPPSTGTVTIVRLILERFTRPPLDLTRCLLSTGQSFGGLRYFFKEEPNHFAFSPLPQEELHDAKRLQVVMDYAAQGPASLGACLEEVGRFQDLAKRNAILIEKQKETIASFKQSLQEAQEALRQALQSQTSRSPMPYGRDGSFRPITALEPLRRQPGKIAVHLHLYYLDMIEEMFSWLSRMPFAYDAVLTVSQPEAAHQVEREALHRGGSNLNALQVHVVPNRGRDIAAFLCAMGTIYRQYDYLAHVHTKKSLYSGGEKARWRQYLMESLFGDETLIRRIFGLFERHPEIGLIYPETAPEMPYWCHSWLSNQRSASDLFSRLQAGLDTSFYIDYPVGSMFWARSRALAPLFHLGLKFEDFPEEPASNDGTLAHAIERSFCMVARLQKMSFAVLDLPRNRFTIGGGRKNLEQYWARSFTNLYDALRGVRRISFDVFDTLITRPVLSPDHVFLLMEKKIKTAYGIDVDFLPLRKQAEIHARKRKQAEVTLKEIYEAMKEIGGLSPAQAEQVFALELETEARLCVPREGMKELIARLLEEGKELTYLSDMYLPSEEIRNLLRRCGFPADRCRIMVSCETGKRKDDGRIWKRFREEVADVHVGDNEHADVQMAVDHGIPCYHVMSPRRLAELGTPPLIPPQWNRLEASIFAGPVWERLFSSPFALHRSAGQWVIDDPFEMGFVGFGPLLLYFTLWLYHQARKRKIQHLLFLAREGYLLQELFRIVEDALGAAGIRQTYLLCSRRATSVPSLRNERDILELLEAPYEGSLENLILSRFGIHCSASTASRASSRPAETVRLPDDRNAISALLLREKNRIFANAEEERSTYLQYLKKNDVLKSGSCAVVDIGFSGTIQKYLARLSGRNLEGFYFVTSARAKSQPLAPAMHGCFGAFLKPQSGNIVYDYSLILESFLTAPQGQLLRFDREGNAVFAPNVYNEEQWPVIRSIHLGIVEYARKTIERFKDGLPYFESARDTAVFFFRRIAENPHRLSGSLRGTLKVDDAYVSGGVRNSFHYAGQEAVQFEGSPASQVYLRNYLIKRAVEEEARFRSRKEFEQYFQRVSHAYEERLLAEKIMSNQALKSGTIECTGFCDGCQSKRTFHSDWSFSEFSLHHSAYLFNAAAYGKWYGKVLLFREQLICGDCKLNNRQRGVFYAARRLGLDLTTLQIYVYEQTTAFYRNLFRLNPRIVGSEYLGPAYPKGTIVGGIRHEDAMDLSFADGSFDVLIANDVFEHVPDLDVSLHEAYRTLRRDGVLLFSIPLDLSRDHSQTRAVLRNGTVEHLHAPIYHGNPISEKGSLVFTDCGWDVIDRSRKAGFRDAFMFYYYSPPHALIGGGLQFLFVAVK